MQSIQITEPAFEPVTLVDLKAHTVVDHDADDHLLISIIETAREQVEADTGRALVEQTWQFLAESFPEEIVLPKPPLVSVTHIKYYDAGGVQQTLIEDTDFQVIRTKGNSSIKAAPGQSWPAVQNGNHRAVEVEYVCGYMLDDGSGGFNGRIPGRIKQAILIWAAHLYQHREHTSLVQTYELPSYQNSIAGLTV